MRPQLELLESYSIEFQSQLRRINSFVKHPGAIGASHEGILRRFLQKYIPKRWAVGEGFVIGEGGRISSQCDIIIWSQIDFAPYYQDGDLVIVPADAVKAVIEIKTTLDQTNLASALRNLRSIHEISENIYTAIFAFESVKIQTILEALFEAEKPLSDVGNSIYAMCGWLLQRAKDEKFEWGTLMETRPSQLKKYEEPLAFSLILPPPDKPVARGLTHFFSFLYTALGMMGTPPFTNIEGSKINGYIFPTYGVKPFSDDFSSEGWLNRFLNQEDLHEYFRAIEEDVS